MTKQNHAGTGALVAIALLTAAGCSQGRTPGAGVSGTALADGPVVGTVTVTDASSPPQRRTAQSSGSGAFVLDASGTRPPYLVKVVGRDASGPRTLYGVEDGHHPLDVNPLTDASYAAAAGVAGAEQAFEDQREGGRSQTFRSTVDLLNRLKTVLAPLLQRYGIVNPFTDTTQVRRLLADVSISLSGGTLTILNAATGATIYTASLTDLAGGTFTADNMPAGTCTTGGGTGGGTGGSDGASLYAASCQSCHGPLATSRVSGASAGAISGAISSVGAMQGISITAAQISAIAGALGGTGGAREDAALREAEGDDGGGGATSGTCGTPCSYGYSDWGPCTDGSQSRTVLTTAPAGCTGTPVLTQTCTAGGAGVCTSYTYGPFGACVGGTQTRTVTSAMPAGCTDQTTNPPALTQPCTTAIDGAALFGTTCQRCHGPIGGVATSSTPISLPTSAAAITGAGMAQGLSADQVTAVAAAVNAANGM
jgi:mono/diheme cytochrome c family protein